MMGKTTVLRIVVSLLISLVAPQGNTEPKADRDFVLISPQPLEAPGQVEVTEFFWYGCPHCQTLEPVLAKWLKTLSSDVHFRRIPTIFPNGSWAPGARLFYALDGLGEEERLHGELFEAIHVELMDHADEKEVTNWLVQRGVQRDKFTAAYASAAVQSKVNRAQALTQEYALRGVPTVVVGGKYLTSLALAGSAQALPGIIDQLISKVRAEIAKAK